MRDQQHSKLVEFGKVWWNDNRNYRKESRPDGNVRTLKDSMVCGWNANSDPVIAMKVGTLDFDENEVKAALEKRQMDYDALVAGVKTDPGLRYKLAAFKLLYCDNHGKLIVPQYAGNSCFGRQSVYLDAVAQFLAMKEHQLKLSEKEFNQEQVTNEGKIPDVRTLEAVTMIPCVIYDFSSEEERLRRQVEENERKMVGNLKPNDLDTFRAAYRLYRGPVLLNESFFRQVFNASRAVKYYSICFLDARFPSLNLVQRILSDPGSEGHIPLKPIDYRTVQSFKARVLNQEGLGSKRTKDLDAIEVHEIAEYFGDPKVNREEGGKVLSKVVWESLAKDDPNAVTRKIAAGNIAGSQDFIVNVLRPNTDIFNFILELIESGKGQMIKDVLLEVRQGTDLLGAVQQVNVLKATVDTAVTEKNQLEGKLTQLAADHETVVNKLTEAEKTVSELTAKVAELSAKRQKVKA